MTSKARRVTTLATVLAMAATAIGVYLYTTRTTGAPLASGSSAAVSSDDLKSALLKESEHPAGTTYQEVPFTIADLAANQGGMVVTPESCLGALKAALGPNAQVSGWMQVGTRSNSRNQFQAAVGKASGALTVAALRAAVGSCASGTISWPQFNMNATISLTEVAAPVVAGASTFAYKSTMRFSGVTEEQLAGALSCSIETSAPIEAGMTENSACLVEVHASSPLMDVTVAQFVSYAISGSVYAEDCEATALQANEMVGLIFDRLRAAGAV